MILTYFSDGWFVVVVVVVETKSYSVTQTGLRNHDNPPASASHMLRLQVSHATSSLAQSHYVDHTSLKLTEICLSLKEQVPN